MGEVQIEVSRIDMNSTNINIALNSDSQSNIICITVKGKLRVCTNDDLETAHLKRLRMIRRQQAACNSISDPPKPDLQIPFAERYIVLDMQSSMHSANEGITPSQEEILLAKLNNGRISCLHATIHAYNSHQDYERHCNSARKKSRLRVDRVTDQDLDIDYSCFGSQLNEGTDFCVQSIAGGRVISSWYLRASTTEVKSTWMNVLGVIR